MKTTRRILSSMLLLVIALGAPGCRLPRPYFALNWHEQRAGRFLYDTQRPEDLPPERAHYEQALAEPVTIVNWEQSVSSTWQILYATNRSPQAASDRPGVRYDNNVLPAPQYGVAVVTLPDRPRGQEDVSHASHSNWPEWLQAVTFRAEHDAEEVIQELHSTVEATQPVVNEVFFERMVNLVRLSPQKDVLLFVHGFNVSFDEAIKRATQLAADLPFNGAFVCYAWPSQGGVDMYLRDGQIVDESLPAFKEFLLEFCQRVPSDANINVVVHSMGNRLVQRALWHLPDTATQPPRFRELVFCAPDVGVDEFKRNMRQATKVSRRVTLYQCTNDTALLASMLKNGEERAGNPNAPLLIPGVDTIETATVDVSLLGHSYYGSNPTVLRDLFAIVKEHAPIESRPWLKGQKIPGVKPLFWRFTAVPERLDWTWHFAPPGKTAEIIPAQASSGDSEERPVERLQDEVFCPVNPVQDDAPVSHENDEAWQRVSTRGRPVPRP